jgi:predicted ABC-type ATPase
MMLAQAAAGRRQPIGADDLFTALEAPQRGWQGLSRAGYGLATGEDWRTAVLEGAKVSLQDVESNATKFGDHVLENTGSPEAATSAYMVGLFAAPSNLLMVQPAVMASKAALRRLEEFTLGVYQLRAGAGPGVHPYLLQRIEELITQGADIDDIFDLPGMRQLENRANAVRDLKPGDVPNMDEIVEEVAEASRELSGVRATPGQPKTVTFVTGPPASGKSAIADPLAASQRAAIPDPDEAKKLLPGYGSGEGAGAVHKASKEVIDGVHDKLKQSGENIVIPTVGDDAVKLANKAQEWRDDGYVVNLVNMLVDSGEAKKRAALRAARTGRLVPKNALDDYGDKPAEVYEELKGSGLFESVAQVDNMVGLDEAKPVLEDTGGLFMELLGFSQ